ncbi:unnamed protein product [Sphagnum compactum]
MGEEGAGKYRKKFEVSIAIAHIENSLGWLEKDMTIKSERTSKASAPTVAIEIENDGLDIWNESDEVDGGAGKFQKKAKPSVCATLILNDDDLLEKATVPKSQKNSQPVSAPLQKDGHGVDDRVKPQKKSNPSSVVAADVENESLLDMHETDVIFKMVRTLLKVSSHHPFYSLNLYFCLNLNHNLVLMGCFCCS